MTKPEDIAATATGIEAFSITLGYKSGPIDGLIASLQAIGDRAETPEEKQEVGRAIEALMAQYQIPLTDAEIIALGA
jgi:hypothetical protein